MLTCLAVRVIVVGGAGAMGRVTVGDLASSPGVEFVTVADLDGGRAAEVAGEAAAAGRGAEVRGVRADVLGPGFVEALREHDVCVASVAYRLNPLVAEGCLAARCGFVDLGGLFHVALDVLDLNDRFQAGGLTGVTCVGGSPGITNLLAVVGARELDRVRRIHVRLGSHDPSVAGLPLPIPYALDTILDEFTLPAMAYRAGHFTEVAPLGEPEEVDYPPPIGRRRSFTTLHSEIATLPRAFPDVEEVTFKIALEPALVQRFELLAGMGLASNEPIEVGTLMVRPRHVLAALARRLPRAAGVGDVECLRVVLEGSREGRAVRVVAESLIEPDPSAGVGGGARDTGIPPSIVAQMIGSGEIASTGMFAPEDVIDPDAFFARLADRGIAYAVRVEPPND